MKQRMKHRTMSPKILLNMAITSFFVPRPYRDKDMTTASLKPSWGTLPGRCLPPRGTRPCSGAGTGLAAGRGSQPQPAEKPSARLVFFYPYISGSARAFFPGGGQDGSQNGRFSIPSRKMAKEKEFFPVFKAGYLCRFFSPPGHYQEMHSKRRRLSAEPRLRAGGCARPLNIPVCVLRYRGVALLVPAFAAGMVSGSAKGARTSGICPRVARWDAEGTWALSSLWAHVTGS